MKQRYIVFAVAVLASTLSQAMVFDNRFMPLIQHPYLMIEGRPSHIESDLFITTADSGFAGNDTDAAIENGSEVGIGRIFGKYNQNDLAAALVALGHPYPMRAEFAGKELPWDVDGKIQTQGIAFSYQQEIRDWLSVGMYMAFMHVNSRYDFHLVKDKVAVFTPSERRELEEDRRFIHSALHLNEQCSSQRGFGDIDAYIRFGHRCDYTLKFRSIQGGVRIGTLIPSGVRAVPDEPSTIPFGGNGHWGVYGSADAEFELKEDWKVGATFRLSKRFARTSLQRMPIGNEPFIFGGVLGRLRVEPGMTIIFVPYFSFENLREGMGVRVQYTLIKHLRDNWTDERRDKKVPVNLSAACEFSQWASSYFTLSVLYDFGKTKVTRGFDPIITFAWDVPTALLVTPENAVKTQKVSLGAEVAF